MKGHIHNSSLLPEILGVQGSKFSTNCLFRGKEKEHGGDPQLLLDRKHIYHQPQPISSLSSSKLVVYRGTFSMQISSLCEEGLASIASSKWGQYV